MYGIRLGVDVRVAMPAHQRHLIRHVIATRSGLPSPCSVPPLPALLTGELFVELVTVVINFVTPAAVQVFL